MAGAKQASVAQTRAPGSGRATGGRPSVNGRPVAERLAELEELYASAPVGLGFLDRDLRYLRVNDRLAEFHGLAAEEHLGRTLEEVVPDIAPKVQEVVERVFASGQPFIGLEVDGAMPGTHGLEKRWRANLHPVRDERGEVLGVSVAVEDLSELGQRIRFDRTLAELSALFINLPAGEADGAIDEGVAKLSEALELDGGGLLQLDDDGSRFRVTHEWRRQGIEITFKGKVIDDRYPWLAERLRAGRPVLISRLDDWPPEAASSRADCEALDIRSAAHVPFSVEGSVAGSVVLDTIGRETGWSDDLVQQMRLAGEIFGNALLRRRRQAEIEGRLEFERVLAELSATFLNLPSGEVDGAIEAGLAKLGETLGMAVGAFHQLDEERGKFLVTHVWDGGRGEVGELRGVVVDDSFPWLGAEQHKGRPVLISGLDDFPPEAAGEREACERFGVRSLAHVGILVEGSLAGCLCFDATEEIHWSDELVQRLRLAGEIFGNALARAKSEIELRQAYSEIERLREKAEAENVYLRQRAEPRHGHAEIVGESEAMRKVFAAAEQVAITDSTVLILGETGTGKELLARWIHRLSPRRRGLMVEVNCAGLPATLIESELFGREKGAYTGALSAQKGRFELADRSTIFLDEVAELPMELQGKLLRVLQEGRFERLGSPRSIEVDARVIAATNRDLAAAVQKGDFREDLYYRLDVFPVTLPPLRERRGDVKLLVWAFVEELAKKMGKSVTRISAQTLATLEAYPWPGNVRELRNVIERAMILTPGGTLEVELPSSSAADTGDGQTFEEVQRRHLERTLERVGWRVRGEGGAAELLALKPTTLEAKMRKLGVRRPG